QPAVSGWKEYMDSPMSYDEIMKHNPKNIGLVCGYNNVEVIDVDLKYDLTGKLGMKYADRINSFQEGLSKKPVVVQTTNKGLHLIYRCKKIEGNQKLAERQLSRKEMETKAIQSSVDLDNPDGDQAEKIVRNIKNMRNVLIETRGVGGYIVAYPSKGYKPLIGDPTEIPEISEEERDILINAAKMFNEAEPKHQPKQQPKKKSSGLIGRTTDEYENVERPIEEFNKKFDIVGYLMENGWSVDKEVGDYVHLTRAGKREGTSASFIKSENKITIFTTSTHLETGKKSAFDLVCENEHNGDYEKTLEFVRDQTKKLNKRLLRRKEVEEAIEEDAVSLVLPESEGYERLNKMIRGDLEMGKKFGYKKLDQYLRYKENQYLLIVGKQNVGKTFFALWLMFLLAMKYGMKFLIYSVENTIDTLKRYLLQFLTEKEYTKMDEIHSDDINREWIHKHFRFVDPKISFSYQDIIDLAEKYYNEEWKYDSLFVDPYNALVPNGKQAGVRADSNAYHVIASNAFQLFAVNVTGVIVNAHVISSSQRSDERPRLDDVQQGTAFTNKAHDGIVIHRDIHSEMRKYITEISVEKIKDKQTGGDWTSKDNPVEFRIKRGMCGFNEVGTMQEKSDKVMQDIEEENKRKEEFQQEISYQKNFPEDKGKLIPIDELTPYDSEADEGEDEVPF
ncbi:MAG: bifunctional DNA primase/polymerase, partial [Fulvivirga sp.]|nr:bifunctional DNA primase/polymerase [Fulvivirga sp.]